MPSWGTRCESLADSLAYQIWSSGRRRWGKCGIILGKEWTWIWVDRLPLVRSGKGGTHLLIGRYSPLVVPYPSTIERTEALSRSFPHPTLVLLIDHRNKNNFHRCLSISRKTSVFPIKRYSPAWNTSYQPNDDATVMQIGWDSHRVKILADLRIERYVNVRSDLSPTFCCKTCVANWYTWRTNRQKACLLIVIRISSNQDGTRELTRWSDQKKFGSLSALLKSKNIIHLVRITWDLAIILYPSSRHRMGVHIHRRFLYFNKTRAMHSSIMFVAVYVFRWPPLCPTGTTWSEEHDNVWSAAKTSIRK